MGTASLPKADLCLGGPALFPFPDCLCMLQNEWLDVDKSPLSIKDALTSSLPHAIYLSAASASAGIRGWSVTRSQSQGSVNLHVPQHRRGAVISQAKQEVRSALHTSADHNPNLGKNGSLNWPGSFRHNTSYKNFCIIKHVAIHCHLLDYRRALVHIFLNVFWQYSWNNYFSPIS